MHIHEFQNMMRRIYYSKDSKRGVNGTYVWLIEEVAELGKALQGESKVALEDEFADVLAWLSSLANLAGCDLEAAALRKYDGKCPRCRREPCHCNQT
ncbi:MAG: MazG nucleotide pyrophosphohydrolase domain-containing protein [Candidatus Bathyarchaeia archaeon]